MLTYDTEELVMRPAYVSQWKPLTLGDTNPLSGLCRMMWRENLSPTYVISDTLASALLDTDLDDRITEHIKLPFASILLRFQEPLKTPVGRCVSILASDSGSPGILHDAVGSKGDRLFILHATYYLSNGSQMTVEEQVPKESTLANIIHQHAIGCMAYCMCPSADVLEQRPNMVYSETRATVVPASTRSSHVSKLYLVGSRLRKTRETGQGSVHAKRYMVRGHIRLQACGTGWSEHKPIWVMPHWRGPELADKLSHIYYVEKGG